MPTTSPGLRERKNERTRAAITRATLELTLERGFEGATIAQIAERADVSPRTIHTWFSSKEQIVLGRSSENLDRMLHELEHGDGDTIDRVQRWIEHEEERFAAEDELGHLRTRALVVDPHLRALERPHLDAAERAIATAIASDVGMPANHLAVRALAGATISLLLGLRASTVDPATTQPGALNDGFAMLRGALTALSIRSQPDR
jgi:AcrR family transcriptional regulator